MPRGSTPPVPAAYIRPTIASSYQCFRFWSNSMHTHLILCSLHGFRTALAAFLVLTSTHVQAETFSFSAVRDSFMPVGEFNSQQYTYTQSAVRTDAGISTVSIPSGNAKSQTGYGVNRVTVENFVPSGNGNENTIRGPFAVAISTWVDRFTIAGGSGLGSAQVSASITGQFGPKPDPSYGGSGSYYLFVAQPGQVESLFSRPLEFIFNNEPQLMAAPLSLMQMVPTPGLGDPGEVVPPQSQFGRLLTGSIDFTYGQPFTIVSVLVGFANDYGVLNAFNSANFGLSGPGESIIETDSGTVYAAAVPEPATSALWLLSGSLLLLAHRRRMQRLAESRS